MLSNLLFWEDVTEYGAAEDRSADRLLRLHRAWDIFNTYLSVDSKHGIGKQISLLNCFGSDDGRLFTNHVEVCIRLPF